MFLVRKLRHSVKVWEDCGYWRIKSHLETPILYFDLRTPTFCLATYGTQYFTHTGLVTAADFEDEVLLLQAKHNLQYTHEI